MIDPRLILLEKAAARLLLVQVGEMEVDEAVAGLIGHFRALAPGILCNCDCDQLARWERQDRSRPRPRRRCAA
jgi:hypothetical protein